MSKHILYRVYSMTTPNDLVNRLSRVQGQIEAIKKNIVAGEDKDCLKTMQLLKAVNNAVKKFGEAYVTYHFDECLTTKNPKQNIEKEIKDIINATFTL